MVEAIVAMFILLVVVIGMSSMFSQGRGRIETRKHYRTALAVASGVLEELKAGQYANIDTAAGQSQVTVGDQSFQKTVTVTDQGNYKQVAAEVTWQEMNRSHEVQLATFIARQ